MVLIKTTTSIVKLVHFHQLHCIFTNFPLLKWVQTYASSLESDRQLLSTTQEIRRYSSATPTRENPHENEALWWHHGTSTWGLVDDEYLPACLTHHQGGTMGSITDMDKQVTHRKDTFKDMCRNGVCSSKSSVRQGKLINCLFLLIPTFPHITPAPLQLKLIIGDYLHLFISKSSTWITETILQLLKPPASLLCFSAPEIRSISQGKVVAAPA